ncbi:MAG TPA: decarboxylating 6-phosphogluconate dehydrogenase [Mycobacteriales bacterium]
MHIGMVGLGRMGGNMAERLRAGGHEVTGYDPHNDASQVSSLKELVAALPSPKIVWIMVPAGDPTTESIHELRELLSKNDIVIDGGNNKWTDDIAHGEFLYEKGVKLLDCGVSGGIWGRKEGYALMVGGSEDDVATCQPIFDTLKPEGDSGFVRAGELGAGHFVKMVHNGIEYAMMQAYAEGYELIAKTDLVSDVEGTFASWQQGTVIRSWLLELLVRALREDPGLEQLEGKADDSGEGRWTVEAAIEAAVPMPAISAALFARFSSRQDDSPAMKVVAALRNQFGGHATTGKGGERSGVLNAPE